MKSQNILILKLSKYLKIVRTWINVLSNIPAL